MSFNELFGGNAIYPADPTFLTRALTTDLVFQWPLEQNMGGIEVLAAEIELTPDAGGHSIFMPDATQGSTGYTTTFYNAGSFSFTIKDSIGGTLGVVASGTAWTLWLRDNTTPAGLWRVFQMGAATSAANAAALAGAGLVAISTTLNEKMEIANHSTNYAILNADRANGLRWTGGVGAFTLPDPATVGASWFVAIKNSGLGTLTINPNGSEMIDGASSLQLSLEDSSWIVTDGTNWFTFGLGQPSSSVFDFLSMSAAGTGDLVLSGSQLNRISYEFTGALTGNRNIIVPNTVQQYWPFNNTTGAFLLTVKTAAGTGVEVPPGARLILYCDGTNVVNAETVSANIPAVVQGDLLYGVSPGVLGTLNKSAAVTRYLGNTGGANNPAWVQVDLSDGTTGLLSGDQVGYPLTPQDNDHILFGDGADIDMYFDGSDLHIEKTTAGVVNGIFIGAVNGVAPGISIGNFGTNVNVGVRKLYAIGAAGAVSGSALNIGTGSAGSANAGGGSALPATPIGYLVWNLGGTDIKIPYYAT